MPDQKQKRPQPKLTLGSMPALVMQSPYNGDPQSIAMEIGFTECPITVGKEKDPPDKRKRVGSVCGAVGGGIVVRVKTEVGDFAIGVNPTDIFKAAREAVEQYVAARGKP